MFAGIERSWALIKASWAVLQSDKELAVFPVVSAVACLVVTILFLFPIATTGLFSAVMSDTSSAQSDVATLPLLIITFLFYVVLYTVIFFCNAALVGAALIRLRGGDPTVRDGFRIASERIGAILGYAVISATVGMILNALRGNSERSGAAGILGMIIVSILGAAWNIVTFLVVPVLVVENVGPIEAIKRSFNLLKKTWGENIIGSAGIGLVFGLASVAIIIVGGGVMALGINANSAAIIIVGGIVLVVGLVAVGLLSSLLSGIYTAAVYHFAADEATNSYFDPALIQGAFRAK